MKIFRFYCFVCLICFLFVISCGCSRSEKMILEKSTKDENTISTKGKNEEAHEVDASEKKIKVFVCGAVIHPGVYEVSSDDRVIEAIALAGGFTKQADETAVNQALHMEDEQQIYIPEKEKKESKKAETKQEDDGKIHINQATKEELMSIPGIGEAKAGSIISYREEHGPFGKIEDLMNISGIKEGVFSKMKDYIAL